MSVSLAEFNSFLSCYQFILVVVLLQVLIAFFLNITLFSLRVRV